MLIDVLVHTPRIVGITSNNTIFAIAFMLFQVQTLIAA